MKRNILEVSAMTQLGQNLQTSLKPPEVAGRFSAQDDEVEKRHLGDTRKPKITLKMLNRLKMIRAAKKLENEQKSKVLAIMYAPLPTEENSV